MRTPISDIVRREEIEVKGELKGIPMLETIEDRN